VTKIKQTWHPPL